MLFKIALLHLLCGGSGFWACTQSVTSYIFCFSLA
jgi:hypothetical protein